MWGCAWVWVRASGVREFIFRGVRIFISQREKTILTQLSPAGHAKKNPDTAPEPGQDHTKSHEITLQVHFTTSTVLRKILTLPWAKNPDTAAGPMLPNKNPDTAQLS